MTDALKMAREALANFTEGCSTAVDAAAVARAAIAAIDAQQAQPPVTGGSPEHLLQDQDRGLSQWLASKPDARLRVREACADIAAQQAATVGASSDPMDWPLPCDVKVGHGTMRKGVPLRTLVVRMKVLYEMATGKNADREAGLTLQEREARMAQFRADLAAGCKPTARATPPAVQQAATVGEPLTCEWVDKALSALILAHPGECNEHRLAREVKERICATPPAVQAPAALTDADIERLLLPWAKEDGPRHDYERNDLIAGVRAVLAAGAAAQGGEHV